MRKYALLTILAATSMVACADWWSFGGDDDSKVLVRISELLEPATELIDEASDLAAEGKANEAVGKYREALSELERIERENPDRAKTAEFASLRNKRAYVNAAIDSLLLSQVRENSRPVAVSDTTELENKLAEERAMSYDKLRNEAMQAMANGDIDTAESKVTKMLAINAKGAAALNLRAAVEMARGNLRRAQATLEEAIIANPESYHGYYNLSDVLLQLGEKKQAHKVYLDGRGHGGPRVKDLEAQLLK